MPAKSFRNMRRLTRFCWQTKIDRPSRSPLIRIGSCSADSAFSSNSMWTKVRMAPAIKAHNLRTHPVKALNFQNCGLQNRDVTQIPRIKTIRSKQPRVCPRVWPKASSNSTLAPLIKQPTELDWPNRECRAQADATRETPAEIGASLPALIKWRAWATRWRRLTVFARTYLMEIWWRATILPVATNGSTSLAWALLRNRNRIMEIAGTAQSALRKSRSPHDALIFLCLSPYIICI